MSDRSKHAGGGDYEVGYGKPPQRSRIRGGAIRESGRPAARCHRGASEGPRPQRGLSHGQGQSRRHDRFPAGDPGHSACQVALAAKGNGAAQRAVIEKVQAIEQELALEAAAEAAETKAMQRSMPERELARRIAWILSGGARLMVKRCHAEGHLKFAV
jgi:hypothetical protein